MELRHWYIFWFNIIFYIPRNSWCSSELVKRVNTLKSCPKAYCTGINPAYRQSPNEMNRTTFLSRPCFCDANCHVYHDCCPDLVPEEELARDAVLQPWNCASWQNRPDPQTLYMVRSCPVKDKFSKFCSLEGIATDEYDYKFDVPVLSNKTGMWYQNIFCAYCHKQADYLASLNLKFNCTNNLTVHEAINLGEYQPHQLTWKMGESLRSPECKLDVSLADEQFVQNYGRRCIHHEHRCASNWTDKSVKNLCHSYTYIVYKQGSVRRYYKNPHCALCNYVQPEDMKCLAVGTRRPRLPSLSLVLELDWNLDAEAQQQANCRLPRGIYDPLHEKCVPVENACNDGFVFENGECIPDPESSRRKTRSNSNNSSILDVNCFVITLAPNEYVVVNDSIKLTLNTSEKVIPNGMFEILNNGDAKVCNVFDIHTSYDILKGYVTTVCLILSVICLILHNVVYCILPKLRNLPGMNLFSLTSALLMAQIIFLLGIYPVTNVSYTLCVTIAVLIHYFFLSSFFWMNAMSLDIWQTFGGNRYSSGSRSSHWKYALYAWGVPFLIISLTVAVDNTNFVPLHLRPNYAAHKKTCWFGSPLGLLIFFVCPMFSIVLINIVLFGKTIYKLHEMKVSMQFIKRKKQNEPTTRSQEDNIQQKENRGYIPPTGSISGNRDTIRFYLYLKLFIIMGLTWISGLIAIFAKVEVLWYIFVVLNGLQGAFIFFMFDFKQKIGNMLWEKLLGEHFEQPYFLKNFTVSGRQTTNTRCTSSSQGKLSSVSSGKSVASEKVTVVKIPFSEEKNTHKKSLELEEIPLKVVCINEVGCRLNTVPSDENLRSH